MDKNIGQLTRHIPKIFALAAALSFCGAVAEAQDYPPPYPRTNAKLVLQNDRVNAWEVYWPKGEPSPMHEHKIDQFSITLSGGAVRVTTPAGRVSEGHSQLGMVVLTKHGTVHQEEGTSDVPQHKIMLEIKPHDASPSATQPSEGAHGTFPPEGTAKVYDYDRLIAWDFSWKPGQKVSVDSENFDTVTVFLVGGTIRSVDAQGNAKDTMRNPGDVVYSAHSAAAHTEESVSGSPRAIIVQLK